MSVRQHNHAHGDPCPPDCPADDTFIGSNALITALYETYTEHLGMVEGDEHGEQYVWCVCGWRSDDVDESYAVHLTNAQHAAAVVALQPLVVRRPEGLDVGRTQAWDEGFAAGVAFWQDDAKALGDQPENPYRSGS